MFFDLMDAVPTSPAPFWESQSLAERLDALRRGRPRIAWLYQNPDTSTFRYRCFNPPMSLAASRPDLGAAWFSLAELPALVREVAFIDVFVISRVLYDRKVAQLIPRLRAAGVRVLFDCDDLVFDTRHVHQIMDTLDQPTDEPVHWDFWYAYIGRMESTARLCDAGLTTNTFLSARLAACMAGAPVGVLPNYLARDQETISRQLLAAKRARGFRGKGKVTIGYFSGTPTHNKDFAVALPALARLFAADLEVQLRIVGFPLPSGPLNVFAGRVEIVPLQDHLNLQRVIAEVEINIAPLQDNTFTNCNSELKFFEAAVVGTWTIATPTFAFRQSIKDGETGRLARAHEWDEALAEAVALVRDPARYAPMAEAAASASYDRYGWERQADRIIEATGVLEFSRQQAEAG